MLQALCAQITHISGPIPGLCCTKYQAYWYKALKGRNISAKGEALRNGKL